MKKLTDEEDFTASNYINIKAENELFVEDSYVIHPVIRVKRVTKGKKENWEITENDKVVFKLEGTKLSKKEKSFLYGAEGISYLINLWKTGHQNTFRIKNGLKSKI